MMAYRRGTTAALARVVRIGGRIAVALLLAGALMPGFHARADGGSGFNSPGDIVIADQFNNRVVEVNPTTHNVVWQFGNGSNIAGPHSIVGTNDAERVGSLTLMAGTGVPAANPPLEPGCANGCVDNRVILVDRAGRIVWQYGHAGVTGAGPNQLNTPVQATFLPNGHILITDQGNERVIEVTPDHQIVWQYGSGDPTINTPVSGVAFASRLPNGDTLVTSSNDSHIVEVNAAGQIVWDYYTNTRAGSLSQPFPTRAVRLRNGNTLISDQFNDQVIEIDANKNIVFTQGQIQVAGTGFNQLNAPYDAKVVGDYTGLTPPFGFVNGG